MMKLFKGIMPEYHDIITECDEPQTRIFDGKEVIGRPTRGFGNSNFYYAGKYMRPEPWDTHPQVKEIKERSEALVSAELNRKIEFTFCLCGFYSKEGKGIPHHSDTVPTESDLVFSISLGAPRIMEWRTYITAVKEGVVKISLKNERFDVLEKWCQNHLGMVIVKEIGFISFIFC